MKDEVSKCSECKYYYLDDYSKSDCSVYPLIFGSSDPVVADKCPAFLKIETES